MTRGAGDTIVFDGIMFALIIVDLSNKVFVFITDILTYNLGVLLKQLLLIVQLS